MEKKKLKAKKQKQRITRQENESKQEGKGRRKVAKSVEEEETYKSQKQIKYSEIQGNVNK